jgi:hypothetical protein
MSTQNSTLDRLQRLEAIYRQGYQSDTVDQTVEKIIALEDAQARRELNAIKARLDTFEKEYRMSSAEFARRFYAGELGDGAEFFEWSAFYDMAQSLLERLQLLETKAA